MFQIAFFGTPSLSVIAFEKLREAGIEPALVVTAPDKPAGRKMLLTPPPLKIWAQEHSFPFVQPEKLDAPFIASLAEKQFDLFIVVAYGLFLPQKLLMLPRLGTLNLHPSLLPKLRGPSPIRSAILFDKKDEVGVSIITLDTEMDHGPIIAQSGPALPEWPMKGDALDTLLFQTGGALLAETIPPFLEGKITPRPQIHEEATFTKKFQKEDGLLDIISGDPYQNYLKFCAFQGWPGVYFFDTKGVRTKITDAAYDHGAFVIKKVIPEGGREIPYARA